jgi:hypothetical protein
MGSYLPIIFSSVFILVLVTSGTFANTAYSQVIPTPSTTSKLHLVKITSPTKGQQVPVGKDLVVSGTSATNKTADCKVSVKVNFINPYHNASPIGVGGNTDYSKWNFILSPAYTTIKPGQNKITAKFACANNPTLASHYSVNVTGVENAANVATTAAKNSIQQISSVASPVGHPLTGASNSTAPAGASNSTAPAGASNSTAPAGASNSTAPAGASNSTTTNSTNSTRSPVSSAATFSPGVNNNNLNPLFVSVHIGKNSIHPGDKQTLTTSVADKTNSNAIAGALVSEKITTSYGVYKKIEGTTDGHGKASYAWTVSKHDTTGTYKVIIKVSAPNYETYSTVKTFKVTSISSSSSSESNDISSTSENINNDNHPSTTETSTSDNTESNTHEQISNSHVGDVNKIHTNANSLGNINSGSSISSSITSGGISSSGISSSIGGNFDSSSIADNHKGNGGGSSVDQNVNGLAQKIINNVKNKLKMHGISLP